MLPAPDCVGTRSVTRPKLTMKKEGFGLLVGLPPTDSGYRVLLAQHNMAPGDDVVMIKSFVVCRHSCRLKAARWDEI